jgi:hypothetical protein
VNPSGRVNLGVFMEKEDCWADLAWKSAPRPSTSSSYVVSSVCGVSVGERVADSDMTSLARKALQSSSSSSFALEK